MLWGLISFYVVVPIGILHLMGFTPLDLAWWIWLSTIWSAWSAGYYCATHRLLRRIHASRVINISLEKTR